MRGESPASVRVRDARRKGVEESNMVNSQLRTKEEILAIRKAETDYAKRSLVAQETVKLVREELANCYMEHGVNHKIACKGLREEYAKLLRDPYFGGGPPTRPEF